MEAHTVYPLSMYGSLNAREGLRHHMQAPSDGGSFPMVPITVSITTHEHTDTTARASRASGGRGKDNSSERRVRLSVCSSCFYIIKCTDSLTRPFPMLFLFALPCSSMVDGRLDALCHVVSPQDRVPFPSLPCLCSATRMERGCILQLGDSGYGKEYPCAVGEFIVGFVSILNLNATSGLLIQEK